MTEQAQEATQEPQQEQQAPWGEDFDAEKAWKLVQNLREDNAKLKQRPVLDDDAKRRLAEYDTIVEASKTDLERAREEMTRWQSEAERWRNASVTSKIQALAATDFQYPEDAVTALDAAKYLDAGGTINEDAIRSDLKALLDARPNWRRGETEQQRAPRPNPAQGSSGAAKSAPDPAQEFASILQSSLRGN